ncbi:MAG: class GN sortase [Gammaproteobacteria bacterium]
MIRYKHLAGLVAFICLSIGVWQLGSAAWIYSKAYLARFLINDAWQATLANNSISKPWSWADTWPVAEISVPAIGLDEIVLSGDSGEALAFGPGLSNAGASFDSAEVKLISAHRDTHFSKLEYIATRDEIFITTPAGKKEYRVTRMKIVDSRTYRVDPLAVNYDLVLATCYPFNAVMAGGHERFIVEAEEIHSGHGGPQAF